MSRLPGFPPGFNPPLDPGTVVNQSGQPVRPPGVDPNQLAAAQREAARQAAQPTGAKPAKAPPSVDLSQLPPEHQREILALMGQISPSEYVKSPPPTAPASAQPWPVPTPPAPLAGPWPRPDEPAPTATWLTPPAWRTPTPPPAPPPPPPAPIPAAPQESTAGGSAPKTCSHCGWDLSVTDDTAVTSADTAAYTEAWLGGKRFRKKYRLFDGKVEITFRTLTTAEESEVLRQVVADAYEDAGRPLPTPLQGMSLIGYRMCLGLESVAGLTTLNNLPTAFPDLASWKGAIAAGSVSQPTGDTPVKSVRRWVAEAVLVQDHAFQTVLRLYTAFDDLSRKLRDQARDPNS